MTHHGKDHMPRDTLDLIKPFVPEVTGASLYGKYLTNGDWFYTVRVQLGPCEVVTEAANLDAVNLLAALACLSLVAHIKVLVGDERVTEGLPCFTLKDIPTYVWVASLPFTSTTTEVVAAALGVDRSAVCLGGRTKSVRLSTTPAVTVATVCSDDFMAAVSLVLTGLDQQGVIVIKSAPWARAVEVPELTRGAWLADG